MQLPPVADRPGEPPPFQIVLEMNAVRQLTINRQAVTIDDLPTRLQTIFEGRRDKTLFISAAATLRYGDVVPLIDAAKGAGVVRVGIITTQSRRSS